MKILVVDDEPIIADSLAAILRLQGFYAVVTYGGRDAVKRAQSENFDVIIMDVMMPDMNGIQASELICNFLPHCKVILLSGHFETADLLKSAHDRGTDFEIFAKPVPPLSLIERLRGIEKERT